MTPKNEKHRYSDKRTTEGKRLNNIIKGIVKDLGGRKHTDPAQELLLIGIKTKIVILFQIEKYIDTTSFETLITEKGDLVPCLSKGYLAYSESLRRDIESLFSYKRHQIEDMPFMKDILRVIK